MNNDQIIQLQTAAMLMAELIKTNGIGSNNEAVQVISNWLANNVTDSLTPKQHKKDASAPPYTVHLEYFNSTGKYKHHGEYKTMNTYMGQIFHEVELMRTNGQLPGINSAGDQYYIHITAPDNPTNYPSILTPLDYGA